ncbi:MAG: hypothetical protein ACRDGD_05830 [Candidatus Limnocylindria bacterium]
MLLLLAQLPPPALADHGGHPIETRRTCDRPDRFPQRCTSVGNNLRHYVYLDATFTDGLASSLRDTMAEDYDPTDLTMIEVTEITDSTDVIAFSQDYGDNGAAGWVYCPSDARQGINRMGDRWCLHQELHLNINPRYAVFFADDASRDHVTCHELGHTLGLRHWGNPPDSDGPAAATCLNSDTPNGPTDLHQIDRDHINDYLYSSIPNVHGPRLIAGTHAGASTAGGGSVAATELEHYAVLGEAMAAADAIVRGRITAIEPGRVFGDPTASTLHYAAVTVEVGELLAGSLPAEHVRELTLEVPLFDGPRGLAGVGDHLGSSETVFFLRSKGASARAAGLSISQQAADAGFYRLVTMGSFVQNHDGVAAVPAGDDRDFLTTIDGTSFARLVDRLRQGDS